MKKRIVFLVAALIAALGLTTVVAATPASADWGCPYGVSCLYTSTDGYGAMVTVPYSTNYYKGCQNSASFYSATGGYLNNHALVIYRGPSCMSWYWLATLYDWQIWPGNGYQIESYRVV